MYQQKKLKLKRFHVKDTLMCAVLNNKYVSISTVQTGVDLAWIKRFPSVFLKKTAVKGLFNFLIT